MEQVDSLTLKSNIKLMHDLLDVPSVLTHLKALGILTTDDCNTLTKILEAKERVNAFVKKLVMLGHGSYQGFLQALHTTSTEVAHKKLRKILIDTKTNLSSSTTLMKEDVAFQLSLSIRGARDEGYPQLCSLIHEELLKIYTGSVRQTLLIEYGLLVKRLELPLLALVCQLQLGAKYGKILNDVGNGVLAARIWGILCEKAKFDSYKKWTLRTVLHSSDEDRLRHFEESQSDTSDEEGEEEEDRVNEAVGGEPSSSLSMLPQAGGNIHPIPVTQMEPPQKIVWNLLLSFITGGNQFHYRHFYHAVQKCLGKADITLLCSNEGFTLFHEMIRQKRADFMQVFQYFDLLSLMYSIPVGETSVEYANIMPTELAGRLNALNERNEMEKLIKIEKTLERDLMKQACRRGDIATFKARTSVDRQRVGVVSEGKTCLDWAITSGSLDIVDEVIKAEKRIKFIRSDAKDQIKVAAILGHRGIIDSILAYIPTSIDSIDVDGKSLMEKSAVFGDIETFRFLHTKGASIPKTTLSLASTWGRLEFIRYYIENYSTSSTFDINFRDRRQKTALHFATERGHPAVIDLLVQNGADLLTRDKRHRSLLHSAAENGKLVVLEKIIHHAQERGHLENLLTGQDKYLGSEQCFLVRGRDQEMSAWHYVQVDRGMLDIFRIKTRGGAVDVAQYGHVIRSGWGSNPSEEIDNEIESKFDMANIAETAPLDMLPLHLVILKSNAVCAIKLVELTPDINKTDYYGLTPLHYACMKGDVQIVAALDARGADRNIRDRKGRTAAQLADFNKHASILEYMRSGTLLQSMQIFLDTHVSTVVTQLSSEELQRRLQDGHSMKQYIKNVLRDLVGDVQEFLFDELQSGPVMEESTATFSSYP